MNIVDSIETYLAAANQIGWAINDKLERGVSRGVVASKLNSVGLSRASELEAFWSLMNGVRDDGGMIAESLLIPGYYPLSIDEALDVYSCRIRDEAIWPSNLFPFLQDGMGHFLSAEILLDRYYTQRVFEHIQGYVPACTYSSLSDLFFTARKGMELGLIFVRDGKFLDVNFIEYQELASELNPGVEFWRT